MELLGSSAKQRNILVYFAVNFQISTVALLNKSNNWLITLVATETSKETKIMHAQAGPRSIKFMTFILVCRCCYDLLQYLCLLVRCIYSLLCWKTENGRKNYPCYCSTTKAFQTWRFGGLRSIIFWQVLLWNRIPRIESQEGACSISEWPTDFDKKKSGLAHTTFLSFEQCNLYALSKVVIMKDVAKSSFSPTNIPCKIQISRF